MKSARPHVRRSGAGRGRTVMATLIGLAALSLVSAPAYSFPIGFSVIGGIGAGYYDMGSLNNFLGQVKQDSHIYFDGLSKGVNVRLEGRVWLYDRVAVTGGYEHLWGTTESAGTSATLTFQAPADVYFLGTIARILTIKDALDLCAGLNLCFAQSVYGTNLLNTRVLSEFTGEDQGFAFYAEAHSTFLNPVQVGFQLGYRSLRIETFTDKYGIEKTAFAKDIDMEIDYSGAFFYFTAGIRL